MILPYFDIWASINSAEEVSPIIIGTITIFVSYYENTTFINLFNYQDKDKDNLFFFDQV